MGFLLFLKENPIEIRVDRHTSAFVEWIKLVS